MFAEAAQPLERLLTLWRATTRELFDTAKQLHTQAIQDVTRTIEQAIHSVATAAGDVSAFSGTRATAGAGAVGGTVPLPVEAVADWTDQGKHGIGYRHIEGILRWRAEVQDRDMKREEDRKLALDALKEMATWEHVAVD